MKGINMPILTVSDYDGPPIISIRKWAIEQLIDITDIQTDGMEYLLTRAETLTQFVLKGIAAAAEDVQQTDELRKHASKCNVCLDDQKRMEAITNPEVGVQHGYSYPEPGIPFIISPRISVWIARLRRN